jgi:hypothetical protein
MIVDDTAKKYQTIVAYRMFEGNHISTVVQNAPFFTSEGLVAYQIRPTPPTIPSLLE